MYNVPSRTGLNINPETAIEIGIKNKNVVAIKEASGNIDNIKRICDSKVIDVYSGNDDQIFDVMYYGGIGVISVLANIFPRQTHEIVYEYLNGNINRSFHLQEKSLDLCRSLFCDVNPIPIKKATEILGMSTGIVREPLIELDETKTKRLIKSINNYK